MTLVDRPSRVEVALVHWPREPERRDELAATMRPRLLLVEPGSAPPPIEDDLEDWVRLPSDEREVAARCEVLAHRADASLRSAIVVDGTHLRRGDAQVNVTPADATLLTLLIHPIGGVVDRVDLEQRLWSDKPPSPKALDDALYRLRRRVRPLGLDLLNLRGRGFLLTTLSPIDTEPAQ